MERIKDAIQKAKQQQVVANANVRTTALNPTLAAASQGEVVDVAYMQTRVAHLDHAHLAKNRIIAFDKSDPMSVSFDILRTKVLSRMEEHGWRTLAITSPVPECGKTVMAINLALSISQHTSKTAMLVDFDLRRPQIAHYLGLTLKKSLNDVLEGSDNVADALINPDIPRMVVLPTARPFNRPSETLHSGKTKLLISDLRERYQERIVLFDLPPLLSSDDVMAVLPEIDCVLLVVGNGQVTSTEINESLRCLQGSELLGVVLNKAEQNRDGLYY